MGLSEMMPGDAAFAPMTESVDVTDLWRTRPDTESVIVLREPGVNQFYTACNDVAKFGRRHPFWITDTTLQVLLLIQCHAEPVPVDNAEIVRFYERLVEREPRVFMRLVRAMYAAFPWLGDLAGGSEANGLGELSSGSVVSTSEGVTP